MKDLPELFWSLNCSTLGRYPIDVSLGIISVLPFPNRAVEIIVNIWSYVDPGSLSRRNICQLIYNCIVKNLYQPMNGMEEFLYRAILRFEWGLPFLF